ncbi:hypothetical protein AQUCO_00400623v1 [Aquilegia coerulea]|uniref:Homeobox domain-containing protein n=1 Tax=Aquilegia coerulea TaxID=218851 RepID=A0A2G5EVT6_AQUCA|nr:hypothetical protein AQUCO_00400623v1 [Aquilegia coerulea]
MISNMRHAREEPTWVIDQPIDLNSVVEELHGLNSQEISKLLRDSENYTLQRCTEGGSVIQIEMEKLARCLPVHLIAVLVSSDADNNRLQYLLRGFRLLHSFCELASRHPKLEQILLEEVRITEQIMDLMFYTVVVLARYKQDNHAAHYFPFLHSTLVACSFYLLTSYISSQWKDLVQVLLAHPEVDLFMDAAFNAVRIDVIFLRIKLSAAKTDVLCQSNPTAVERSAHILCQQCEASLQFLHSLCEQKVFRERLLKNKELCKNGGILLLVQAVLNLDAQHFRETSKLSASVSRMKSKVLSILLQLCEIESISYLDEVASSPRSMQVAKFVALEVLKLMKTAFGRKKQLDDCGESSFPRGLVLLNTMRLADIFSDDSNLRYYITTNTVVEEDASLEYDSFTAAGAVFVLLSTGFETSKETTMECSFNLKNLPQISYAQQKTSLLVKIIANLHCFVPNICEEEERDLFFNKFLECLGMELPKSSAGFPLNSNAENGAIVCKNMASLLDYASCLVPTFLNEDDVHLISKFFKELQSSVTSKTEGNMGQEQNQDEKVKCSLVSDKFSNFDAGECNQETQSGGYGSSSSRKLDAKKQEVPLDYRKSDYPKEGTSESLVYQDNVMTETGASEPLKDVDKDPGNVETSGSEASPIRGKDSLDQLLDNGDCSKLAEHSEGKFKEVEGNDKSETTNGGDKQQRKRKRNIMNDKQITLIERALLDEPEMQRNAGSLQSWADKLSAHGSELTSSQLKNWLC